VPLTPALAVRLRQHIAAFPPLAVTLPWSDPEPPATPLEERQRRPITVDLLFTSSAKMRINPRTWNERSWKPALEKAGLITSEPHLGGGLKRRQWEASRELGFHVLRHTFASVQLEAGESPVTLAAWLGHSSPTITLDRYAHFMPGAGARGMAAMDAWFAPPAPILPQDSPGPFRIMIPSPRQQVDSMIAGKLDMKVKYKETSRGGLAVNVIEC
jgi:integrase